MIFNEFYAVRDLLERMRVAVGGRGLVAAAWNGDLLSISHAIPESGKHLMVMTFDGLRDYEANSNTIIQEFARTSAEYFGERIAPSAEENAA
jgi:hypothetical protein